MKSHEPCRCEDGMCFNECSTPLLDFESATGVVTVRKKFEPRLLRWTGGNAMVMLEFCRREGETWSDFGFSDPHRASVYDYLHDSWIDLDVGDWVAEGSAGEHYPIAHAILISDYERTA